MRERPQTSSFTAAFNSCSLTVLILAESSSFSTCFILSVSSIFCAFVCQPSLSFSSFHSFRSNSVNSSPSSLRHSCDDNAVAWQI